MSGPMNATFVAARSMLHGDDNESLTGVWIREHGSRVRRLRVVLVVGLLLWVTIGVPSDIMVAATFHADLWSLLPVRAASAFVMLVGAWSVSSKPAPSPRMLLAIEIGTFASCAAAIGCFVVLDVGLASPTTALLSCLLLAQGTAFPRQWKSGALMLSGTCASFLAVVAAGAIVDGSGPVALSLFASGVWSAFGSLVVLVVGGHAAWHLRRSAYTARHVGRYELLRKIGEGGTGEVWVAWHAGLKRDVAVKVLRAARFKRLRDRFLTEIEATSRLCHPNTVRVLDRGVADGDHWYYAMELVDGRSLRRVVEEDGVLSPARAVHVASQVARALAEAHGLGIVHRDLNPDNVLLSSVGPERDFAKVCDFGLALMRSPSSPPSSEEEAPAAEPGCAGTWRWAAPEQMRGLDVDARADVWALGGLLMFALTGRSPRDQNSEETLCLLPLDLRLVVERCLERCPADRYADAGAVARALLSSSVATRASL